MNQALFRSVVAFVLLVAAQVTVLRRSRPGVEQSRAAFPTQPTSAAA